jgi:hypothetical protein
MGDGVWEGKPPGEAWPTALFDFPTGALRGYTDGPVNTFVSSILAGCVLLFAGGGLPAADVSVPATLPSTQPAKLPHLEVDLRHKRVRMECEAVNASAPLEFFVCAAGGAEHETVLRSRAKASHVHLALLMLGIEPGQPLRFAQPGDRRIAPTGPLLKMTCEFSKDGRAVSLPPHRMMRDIKTKQALAPLTFVFAGSRLMSDGRYAADVTGHLISVVNFEYSVIDLPELRSNSNDMLEWEINPDVVPPRDATVWLTIERADGKADGGRGK